MKPAVAIFLTVSLSAFAADYGRGVIELLGHRTDKNTVGHGRNVALYTDSPSKFFFATHSLGDVFNAVDGQTIEWFPDHVRVRSTNVLAGAVKNEHVDVCVTSEDVVVARMRLTNSAGQPERAQIVVSGDCRNSADWREKPGGEKETRRLGDFVVLRDHNVFPGFLKQGLALVIGAKLKSAEAITDPPGTYRLTYDVEVPGKAAREITLACAIDPDARRAEKNLRRVLAQEDPLASNRDEWARWFDEEVPRFRCSDKKLEELYAFRWFLLRFSTCGGGLGYFTHPVVLEGRQAYQTYCCYSAPFLALDLNWSRNARTGFGHIATMTEAAYDDGRFPWYCSPRTNRVMVHHESRTGLSLLPQAAWKFYLIHGDKKMLRRLYPAMKKNMEWWIKDRDPDSKGLFQIAHQYETGMDDLHRWGEQSMTWRYEAVDATSYAYANLRAVENMARVLGETGDEQLFGTYADKTAAALKSLLWEAKSESWRDRNPKTQELAEVLAITTFYPFFSGAAGKEHLDVLRKHLLNPEQFWLPHPVPALAKDQRDFNPDGFWQGPSWPAATTHVVEGFATTAKQMDRSLLPEAAELFRRAAYNHLQPRADFYERYNPLSGRPLSTFRDYMHSWWIDLFIRHVAGLTIEDNGRAYVDPLPMGLDYFTLENVRLRGKRVDISWVNPRAQSSAIEPGLTVRVDGRVALRRPMFAPAAERVALPIAK